MSVADSSGSAADPKKQVKKNWLNAILLKLSNTSMREATEFLLALNLFIGVIMFMVNFCKGNYISRVLQAPLVSLLTAVIICDELFLL